MITFGPGVMEHLESVLVGAPCDFTTRKLAETEMAKILSWHYLEKTIRDYNVICDQRNNTADDVTNNRINLSANVTPVGSPSHIHFTMVISS